MKREKKNKSRKDAKPQSLRKSSLEQHNFFAPYLPIGRLCFFAREKKRGLPVRRGG